MPNENNGDGQIMGGTIAMVRNYALTLFAKNVAAMNHCTPKEISEEQHAFLSLDETEAIVKEHSALNGNGFYAIGGETEEEFNSQMRKMFEALMTRIESNVAQLGVKLGYLDCAFDEEANDFTFSVTEKGREEAQAHTARRNEPSNN